MVFSLFCFYGCWYYPLQDVLSRSPGYPNIFYLPIDRPALLRPDAVSFHRSLDTSFSNILWLARLKWLSAPYIRFRCNRRLDTLYLALHYSRDRRAHSVTLLYTGPLDVPDAAPEPVLWIGLQQLTRLKNFTIALVSLHGYSVYDNY